MITAGRREIIILTTPQQAAVMAVASTQVVVRLMVRRAVVMFHLLHLLHQAAVQQEVEALADGTKGAVALSINLPIKLEYSWAVVKSAQKACLPKLVFYCFP